MSLLSEVLKGAEKVDVEEINKKVPELKKTVEILKTEGLTYVENVYLNSKKSKRSQRQLLVKRGHQVEDELNTLGQKANFVSNKKLVKTDHELSKNIEELQIIDFSLHIVLNMLNLDKLLNQFEEESARENYLSCAKILVEMETNMNSIPPDEKLDIISELQCTVEDKKLRLGSQVSNIITEFIDVQTNEKDFFSILKIKKQFSKIEDALQAAYFQDKNICALCNTAIHLWQQFFLPAVESTTLVKESESEEYVTLSITVTKSGQKANYKEVFSKLKIVLDFLIQNFNKNLAEDITTLEYIGEYIRDNLSELIIKSCLRDTIPNTDEELQKYKTVIEDTEKLEKKLFAAKIFTNDTESILAYANNVDTLFINKKCQKHMETAIEIMKKDFHDMEEVGKEYDPFNPDPIEFTKCAVSKNVFKLLELCESLLQEAVTASPECAGRLVCTVQNIIQKYAVFVPEFHKNYLQSLPQQIALFHNNCIYIAHILTGWDVKYCQKHKPLLTQCNFFNESQLLPLVALEVFSKYIEGQVKQTHEIMEGAELSAKTIEKVDPKTEKCVRQCLRQQELLKTVWHKVLSYSVYNKNLGVIVDSLCKFIIKSVIKYEDISAEVASNLGEIIKLILTRAPKLFINSEEIPIFVSSWYKLNELHFLLDASLAHIDDRWADGKGPLALQFERSELKQIIKALFQNTDRRAALLRKI